MPWIPKSKRFAPRTKNEYVFMDEVAAVAADGTPEPTAAEISGGVWLTREVFSVDGFSTNTNFAQTSDASTFFIGKVPVSAEANDASMTFNASEDGQDARQVFEEGQRGYMYLAPSHAEGSIGEVYEVIVGAVSVVRDLNDVQKVVVGFGVPSKPNQKFTIPTGITVPTA